MLLALEKRVREAVGEHIQKRYSVEVAIVVEQPPQPQFGEVALPVGFALAKLLKRPPRKIIEEIVDELQPIPGVATIEPAGAGYVNMRFERGAYASALKDGSGARGREKLGDIPRRAPRRVSESAVVESALGTVPIFSKGASEDAKAASTGELSQDEADPAKTSNDKIIVEHTNINPNKAAHIGHLRNAVLGDTLVRMLRELGHQVEVQNYIDNTGVQVADVVAAFHFLEKKSADDVRALIDDPDVRFDYYCWDLYARVSQLYETGTASQPWRAETLHAIESDEGPLAELGRIVSEAIVQKHLDTMARIGVRYDVLPRESEILHLKFWASAFELLKERKAIHFETEGKNKGCWVMPAELFQSAPAVAQPTQSRDREGAVSHKRSENDDESAKPDSAEAKSEIDDSKVIVRSNGTVTYVGKDIAYQLWKFGLLEKDFHYAPFRIEPDGGTLWASSVTPGDGTSPRFGKGSRVYNVIDVRQSYLQDVVRAGLRSLGFDRQADASIHFSYEMVALSPRCCAEMGIELSEEDRRKPYVEVSGRKGLGVKADDLIDLLIKNALGEVQSRHENASEAEQTEIATKIAVGALRFFMLRFTRTSVIAFDFQEALSFEGETGPYIQYAVVRARNILRKLGERGDKLPDFEKVMSREVFDRQLANEDFWQMLLEASRRESATEKAAAVGEPAHLARFGFQLAQAFNNFYHRHHILNETDPERKAFLLWMTTFFLGELETVLDTMGIPAPEVM